MSGLSGMYFITHLINTVYLSFKKRLYQVLHQIIGLLWWLSGKESACQCSKGGFDP